MKSLLLIAVFSVAAFAQHVATLTWADGVNPPGVIYSVYRAPGACILPVPASPAFTQIAAAIAVLNYSDSTIGTGAYCYAVSATVGGIESVKSNYAQAQVLPSAPTGLTVVVK
jgi:hypothetical protein